MRRLTLIAFLTAAAWAAPSCQTVASLSLPDTKISFARPAEATTMLGPGGTRTKTPPFCRVGGVIRPTGDSNILFEVWLPIEHWNGRFRAVGNGGFAGYINYPEMAAALRDGYATASTDTGHQGSDSAWALGHPEKISDYGHRAVHEMTVKAKAIVQAFYGEPAKHSYFASCSNGGRQALMEAQRYPEDYDGIIAGAPANYWTHLLTANFYAAALPMMSDRGAYIPSEKVPAIANAVLAACDAKDGVKDGVLNDPRDCHFDPASMLCHGADSDSCLTEPQVASLKRIYAGAHNADGSLLYPGYEPGGEDGPGGWSAWINGKKPGTSSGVGFSMGFLRHMVFDDTAWKADGTDMVKTIAAADAKMSSSLNSTNPDLRPFQSRGGKLILFHGWADAAIPPKNAIFYYDTVKQAMGAESVAAFSRLYMVAGMQHCAGGPGPNVFGQYAVMPEGQPDHDMFSALVQWVEHGVAPESIVATKFTKGLDSPVEMTRPICPYPSAPVYKGSGDWHSAENFSCSAPTK